jgi:small conductance mechanosensitive channel
MWDWVEQTAWKLLYVVLAIAISFVSYKALAWILTKLLTPSRKAVDFVIKEKSSRTLVPLMRSALKYIIGFVALMAILRIIGVNPSALIAGAGIVGLAIGLGAQTVLRDVITGLFLLFEGVIAVGDMVSIGAEKGVVEEIGFRVTKIRKETGELLVIPNGLITQLTNYSHGYLKAVAEFELPLDGRTALAIDLLHDLGRRFISEMGGKAFGDPEVTGTINPSTGKALLRLGVMVDPEVIRDAEWNLRLMARSAMIDAGFIGEDDGR